MLKSDGLSRVTISLLFVLLFSGATGSAPAAQESPVKPNFVFILADDMRKDDLKYMPKTQALLRTAGMQFQSAFVSTPLCCPSRATILRGQYAHNSGVWNNGNNDSPYGGWQAYKDHGYEQDNLATRLHDAGYRTGLFDKYLNYYDGSTVPPGWDDWFATFEPGEDQAHYFDYEVNDNGTIKHYGTEENDYITDVTSKQTQQFIGASVAQGKPFFAYVASRAPHGVARPAPRDEHTFDGEKAPRPPSFNENDVSDKPPWIRALPRLDDTQKAEIDAKYEGRVETLQALDDLVEAVWDKLRSTGVAGNTYVVFTSDNGFHLGEHRIALSKGQPYEESVHMPLLIRGPKVQAGSTTRRLTLNTDFFPTFTDLAGIQRPPYVDGRSLRPLLEGSTSTWRTAILLERAYYGKSDTWFSGIRTSDGKKYLEYEGGLRELYDLNTDLYELKNSYNAATPPKTLAARLQALKTCGADAALSCRTAEDGQEWFSGSQRSAARGTEALRTPAAWPSIHRSA
jgi:N-acetylglucosamine-6-sulfatase